MQPGIDPILSRMAFKVPNPICQPDEVGINFSGTIESSGCVWEANRMVSRWSASGVVCSL